MEKLLRAMGYRGPAAMEAALAASGSGTIGNQCAQQATIHVTPNTTRTIWFVWIEYGELVKIVMSTDNESWADRRAFRVQDQLFSYWSGGERPKWLD